MSKLRLAFASIEYPPDPLSSGIGTYTKAVATQLAERGHRVFVVTRGYKEADSVTDEEGVTVYRLTPKRPELPPNLSAANLLRLAVSSLINEWRYRRKLARTLYTLVEDEQLDLIEAADHVAEPIFYRPKRHPHVPFVVRLHTPLAFSETVDQNIPELARRAVAVLERNFLKRATHLSAPSQNAAKAFLDLFKLERPVAVFPNPTSYALPERSEQAHLSGSQPPTVLFVGRVTRWKGAHLLMQAVPKVLQAVPEAQFVIAGSAHVPTEGFPSTRAYLLSLVPEEHHRHITFLGHVPHAQLEPSYERATLCVFPSLFDNFPYTCLEAMTHGKAIVGSTRGGMMEMLGGDAGNLFTPPDIDELARYIITLLQNESLRAELGRRASERVKAHYAPEVVMAQTEAFYRRAIAER